MSKIKERKKRLEKKRRKAYKKLPKQLRKFREFAVENKLFRKAHINDVDNLVVTSDGGFLRYFSDKYRIYIIYHPQKPKHYIVDTQVMIASGLDEEDLDKHEGIVYERAHTLKRAFKSFIKHTIKKKK